MEKIYHKVNEKNQEIELILEKLKGKSYIKHLI